MKNGGQTAIRGVLSVGSLNFLARLIGYGKHIVITAYIGLTAELDAFNMAATVLALCIYVFGDIFDSLGVPRLVQADKEEGEEAFLRKTGTILSMALGLSLVMTAFMIVAMPYLGVVAPGFSEGKKQLLRENLLFLLPVGLLYLPYHAMGSFLRARRRFQAFYVGELLMAVVTFVILILFHGTRFVIPISFSVAYTLAIIYLYFASRRHFRFAIDFSSPFFRESFRLFLQLLPIYMVGQLYMAVDRFFASYLDTGGISALSYGFVIIGIPVSVLMLENIFITPLAEAERKDEMMGRIVSGILIISIPMAAFLSYYAFDIVKFAFERGVFTTASTQMTSEALRILALYIPGLFLNPMLYRLLQVTDNLKGVVKYGFLSVAMNIGLNFLFLRLGMGLGGLALATILSGYFVLLVNFLIVRGKGLRILSVDMPGVVATSLAASAISIGATILLNKHLLSLPFGIILVFAIYSAILLAAYFVVPNKTIKAWVTTISSELSGRPA